MSWLFFHRWLPKKYWPFLFHPPCAAPCKCSYPFPCLPIPCRGYFPCRDETGIGESPAVKVYDFVDKELGKAAPYGVYDIAKNDGWVSVGISSDTASFAVNTIKMWWQEMGKQQYVDAKKIYINADGGGSNGSTNRLWKHELQLLATELKLEIHVSHFPPGTSKWNKIEHRMFSQITRNWRAKPLESIRVIVNLIANTTTEKGLKINAKVDKNEYPTGRKISDKELAKINIVKNEFKGKWNYIISP